MLLTLQDQACLFVPFLNYFFLFSYYNVDFADLSWDSIFMCMFYWIKKKIIFLSTEKVILSHVYCYTDFPGREAPGELLVCTLTLKPACNH